jgi:predicted phosphodiesterase
MITIGVLSDTHLIEPNKEYIEKATRCFAGTDMILHAGDLTSLSVLEAFAG